MEVADEILDAIGDLESLIRDGARVDFEEGQTVTPLEWAFRKMEEHARYEYLDGFIPDRVILRILSVTSFPSSVYLSGKNSQFCANCQAPN